MVMGRGGALHLAALPGQLIELLALDLDGGVHGGDLLDGAPEAGQDSLQLPGGHRGGSLLQHRAGGVLGVGDQTQTQPGQIFLLPLRGELNRPGGPPHKDGQYAGGHGVQGAGVPDPPLTQAAAQPGAHIHAGPVLGFVNDQDSVRHCDPSVSRGRAPTRSSPGGCR